MRTFVEKFGIKALRRFLSNDEIALCLKQSGQSQVKFEMEGGCVKALGVGIGRELGFLDICINKNSKNAPYIFISDKKKAYFGFNSLALSISHDGGFAIAAVICV